MAELNEKQEQAAARAAVSALEDKKGADIEVLKVSGLTTLADYYILCTGQSAPQLRALADAAEEAMARLGRKPKHIEGYPAASWILQDFGGVVVHIFQKETRAFYSLERLWADAPRIDPAAL